jgi:hypothetical protein
MSTTNSEIKPPGVKVPHDSVQVEKLEGTTLEFAFKSSTEQPLQPLVVSKINKKEELKISAVVFIAEDDNGNCVDPESIFVQCQKVISESGNWQLDFFIVYNAPETKAKNFQGYSVDVTIKDVPEEIEHVCAFLWDDDPRTSRGTVTRPSRVR